MLVIAQLFNAFNARSETGTAFHRVFANPWLWGAVVLSLALQVAVVQSPLLNAAFTTTPLSPSQWLVCAAMASTCCGPARSARPWSVCASDGSGLGLMPERDDLFAVRMS